MIIVHIDFTGTYNEEMNYQENLLPRINKYDGNSVFFITTCYRWNMGNEEIVAAGYSKLSDGVELIRVPYTHLCFEKIDKKVRAVKGLGKLLESISPDVIMLHCIQTLACFPVMRYVKSHPFVKLFADTHTDFNNSARNFFSREILHKIFYKPIVKKLRPLVGTFLCCSFECMQFMTEVYKINQKYLEYYPLGGIILSDEEYMYKRNEIRKSLGISNDDVLLVHSGKLNKQKKTMELLEGFRKISYQNIKLLIVGSMDEYVSECSKEIIESDIRIKLLGWKTGEELNNILCACDLYCQPGTQSVVMQNAACARCALMLYPYESHFYLWGNNNSIVYYVKSVHDIEEVITDVVKNRDSLSHRVEGVFNIAKEKLDYHKLASRIYR